MASAMRGVMRFKCTGRGRARRVVAGGMGPGLEKDLLRGILGVVGLVQRAGAVDAQAPAVGVDQPGQRPSVALRASRILASVALADPGMWAVDWLGHDSRRFGAIPDQRVIVVVRPKLRPEARVPDRVEVMVPRLAVVARLRVPVPPPGVVVVACAVQVI